MNVTLVLCEIINHADEPRQRLKLNKSLSANKQLAKYQQQSTNDGSVQRNGGIIGEGGDYIQAENEKLTLTDLYFYETTLSLDDCRIYGQLR